MRSRRILDDGRIVWFGSAGVDEEGKAIKYDNYTTKQEAVANSLRQRLSVLKHELWYDYNKGIPLIDKVRSKTTIDTYIMNTILEHPDVINIEDFVSKQDKQNYSCYVIINTIYGQIELGL